MSTTATGRSVSIRSIRRERHPHGFVRATGPISAKPTALAPESVPPASGADDDLDRHRHAGLDVDDLAVERS
ncbi:MAG: hypothetical protein R2713_24100 [Ilumatobacteraceae bacterium]